MIRKWSLKHLNNWPEVTYIGEHRAKSEPWFPDLKVHGCLIHRSGPCLTHSQAHVCSQVQCESQDDLQNSQSKLHRTHLIHQKHLCRAQNVADFWPQQFPNTSSTSTFFLRPLTKSELQNKSWPILKFFITQAASPAAAWFQALCFFSSVCCSIIHSWP